MSIHSRPVSSAPTASGPSAAEQQAETVSTPARVKRAPAPATPAHDEAAPRVERWLYFILASSAVMVVGFFVPRAALRPTVSVAIALMAIGLGMLMVQSWRTGGEG